MIVKKFVLQPLAVAALLISAGASHAAFINTFATLAAFNAATVQQGTDQYNGLSITGTTPSPLARATQVGTVYNYRADAGDGSFFGGGATANPFLSTNIATDTITLNLFSPAIRAIGGNFFGSDPSGAFTLGDMAIVVTDSFGATFSQTITNAPQGGFLGVLSNGFITSLTITTVQPASGVFIWPSADNLVMAIPEPGTYALMLAGLGLVGFLARRRRA